MAMIDRESNDLFAKQFVFFAPLCD